MAQQEQVYAELDRACTELTQSAYVDDTEQRVMKLLHLLSVLKQIEGDHDDASGKKKENVFFGMDFLKALRMMLCDSDSKVRVQAVRAMRYLTCNQLILQNMNKLNVAVFVMICLEREGQKYYWERLGALKWLRHLIDNYPLSIPRCCVMSLICIAQNNKHEYRRICLDSLRELCIINPLIVQKCNGFKVLIELILNPQINEISNSLILTILYILDHPNTRKYLRPSLDIQPLFAPFVGVDPYKALPANTQKQQIEQRDRMREIAQRALNTMLKSVTGIFYLACDHNANTYNTPKHVQQHPHTHHMRSSSPHNDSFLAVLVNLMNLPNNIKGI